MIDIKTIVVNHDLIGRYHTLASILRDQFFSISAKRPIRVLDIGSYDRALGRSLNKCGLDNVYHSLDIDTSEDHDFQNISQVNETYDVICMFELIEHLTLEEVDMLLHKVNNLLIHGGKVYISTPNPFHLTRFFSDITHKQHWPATDLYAYLRHVGFEHHKIEMYGIIYRDTILQSSITRILIRHLREFAWRLLGIDIRGGILAIATKS